MKILTPSYSKEILPKSMKSLVLSYLEETGMQHTAFCYKHEAQVIMNQKIETGKLLSLVQKGFMLENLEKESQQVVNKLNKQVINYANSAKDQRQSFSREEQEDTLKKEISLKHYISSKINSELNRMMEGSLSGMRNSRTTFSSSFSNGRDDILSIPKYHEHNRLTSNPQNELPDIAFRTGNFNKKTFSKKINKSTLCKQPRLKKNYRNSSSNLNKQLSQSQIDFDKYNSKFSFAPPLNEDIKKMKDFMFKTHRGKFHHAKSKSFAYSFDGCLLYTSPSPRD